MRPTGIDQVIGNLIGTDPGTGGIQGQVVDNTAAPVVGASVDINHGFVTTTTNSSGGYNFASMIAGSWEVTVSKTGYAAVTHNVTLAKGGTVNDNFTLATAN